MKRFLASLVAASLAFASPASAKWEGPYRWCKCLLTGNYGPHCCKPIISAPCYPCLNGCTNGECNGPTLDPHGVPDVFWTMVGDGEQCYLDLTHERSVIGGDIGANQDAIAVGAMLGVAAASTISYLSTSSGVEGMSAKLSTRAMSYRSGS